mgnify:CR=1 FL=1
MKKHSFLGSLFATLAILGLAASSSEANSSKGTPGSAPATQSLGIDGLNTTNEEMEGHTRPTPVHDNDVFYYDLPHIERALKDFNLRLRTYALQMTFDLNAFIFRLKDLEKELLDFHRSAARGNPSRSVTSLLGLGLYLLNSLTQYARAMLPYQSVGTDSGNQIYAMMELRIKTLALQSAPNILDIRLFRHEDRVMGLWRSMNLANTQFGQLTHVPAEERKVFKNEFAATRRAIKSLGKQIELSVSNEFLSPEADET